MFIVSPFSLRLDALGCLKSIGHQTSVAGFNVAQFYRALTKSLFVASEVGCREHPDTASWVGKHHFKPCPGTVCGGSRIPERRSPTAVCIHAEDPAMATMFPRISSNRTPAS
jgi:hypothetical protein